jgi:anti-sigma-K factor RskA
MREHETIGVDEHALDDATLEALADAHATPPPRALQARVLAAARRETEARETAARGRAHALRRWRAVGAMAAAVALVVGGIALRQSRLADVQTAELAARTAELGARTTELASLARTNADLSARLDEQGRTLAGLREAVAAQAQVLHVLAGPHTLTAALAPKEGIVGSGRVVVDAATGDGAIVLSGLADPGQGRAYELWAIRGDRPPEPSGVFALEPGRPLAARIAPVVRASEVTAFAVSIEPSSGSASPTGPIVLVGAVAS